MIELRVKGMSCDHCVAAIDRALAGVDGVQRVVEVDLETGKALIDGEPEIAELITAVEREGYEAEVAG